jgi:Xaa-Pro aminopeptidase
MGGAGNVRVEQLQPQLRAAGVDVAVIRMTENVLFVTGHFVQIAGAGFAVVPAEGEASLLVPEYEAPEAAEAWAGALETFPVIRNDRPAALEVVRERLAALAARHANGGAVGYEGSSETLAPPAQAGEASAVGLPTRRLIEEAFGGAELSDVTELLEATKAVKTERDLEKLEIANEIACFGNLAFKEAARPGRTEVEIAAAVETAIEVEGHGYRGARVVRGYATVYSGTDLQDGWQYFRSRPRRVEPDDLVMLELGTLVDGYWADHTRTVVAGRASREQRAAYEAVRAAAAAAFAVAVPGAVGGGVDATSRETCASAGFEQFPHHTGHGVGFRLHESRPQLVPGSTHELGDGMVIVTEPGVYGAEVSGGIRYEDAAVVRPGGARLLGGTDYGLDD